MKYSEKGHKTKITTTKKRLICKLPLGLRRVPGMYVVMFDEKINEFLANGH